MWFWVINKRTTPSEILDPPLYSIIYVWHAALDLQYYSAAATKMATRSLVVGVMNREKFFFFNKLLLGELTKKRPCHGTKKRWKDIMKVELQAICVYDRWCEYATTVRHGFHFVL